MTVERFSSRLMGQGNLAQGFLKPRLKGALSYDRIAGYFRSSLLALVGEELEAIPKVRIVCNSDLDPKDIEAARAMPSAFESAIRVAWNDHAETGVDRIKLKGNYAKLADLLESGRLEIRVVPSQAVFVHGKAGIIQDADGRKTAFIGSANDSYSAFATSYELIWEDSDPAAVEWAEAEFEALWANGVPLPQAIVQDIRRLGDRVEIELPEAGALVTAADADKLVGAALVESPLYLAGNLLMPWQKAFVRRFLKHRETWGKARLLLADEVGLGKTFSLAVAALMSALLDNKPVLILVPSTLTKQWQAELYTNLGIPACVWLSQKKAWLDSEGHTIPTRGAEGVVRCPTRIAIVSTGLIVHKSEECERLLRMKYGCVVLDEAHKARKQRAPGKKEERTNLLDFLFQISFQTQHLLLGTATPIQTDVLDLWDLLEALNGGAGMVLGNKIHSVWSDPDKARKYIGGLGGRGLVSPTSPEDAWELAKSPLPPEWADRDDIASLMLQGLGMLGESVAGIDRDTHCSLGPSRAMENPLVSNALNWMTAKDYFKINNPLSRHIVLRRRRDLEDRGILPRIDVRIHPTPNPRPGEYVVNGESAGFVLPENGLALSTNHFFDEAYRCAEDFCKKLGERAKGAGFIKSILAQRLCSSTNAGLVTAQKILGQCRLDLGDDEPDDDLDEKARETIFSSMTLDEKEDLVQMISWLDKSLAQGEDPKLKAVKFMLLKHRLRADEGSVEKTWLEHGCIVFTQYYDTALWVAQNLAAEASLFELPIALYAGVGKSRVFHRGQSVEQDRNQIKKDVADGKIELVVATDAACEGLNLQKLGTLINIDLPWNPSRLEQRIGRIKRMGQRRPTVDLCNLVYDGTRDKTVYQALSNRLRENTDILGGLPDTLWDDWIEDQIEQEKIIAGHVVEMEKARNTFDIQSSQDFQDEEGVDWGSQFEVLPKEVIQERLRQGWK